MPDMEYWNSRWAKTNYAPPSKDIAVEVGDAINRLRPKPQAVLDFGCGIGRYCPFFSTRKMQYTGYDPSAVAIALCNARFWDTEIDIQFTSGLPCETFPLVFANVVLGHSHDDVFWQIQALSSRWAICVEATWDIPAKTKHEHMVYRTRDEFLSHWPSTEWTLLYGKTMPAIEDRLTLFVFERTASTLSDLDILPPKSIT